MAENKQKKKPQPKTKKSSCNCTCLLYALALIGVVMAGAYYYVNHGCDLSKEHEEMDCRIVFFMRFSLTIFRWRMLAIELLSNWGVVDFKETLRSYLDTRDMNTTQLYSTPNLTQLPVLVQEWEYNGFKLYTYTPNELVGIPNQPVLIHLHGGGGVMLSPKYFDSTIRFLADRYKLKFILPDYPKSPEVLFPTAHEICVNVVKHVFENSEMFSVDPKRISLSGDSFGGHAVLYVAFKWRELGYYKKYAPLHTLTLIYPWVQFVNLQLDSFKDDTNHRIISPYSTAVASSLLIKGDLGLTELMLNSSLPLMSQYYTQRQTAVPELLPKQDWEPPQSMIDTYSHYADTVLDPYVSFLFQTDFSHFPSTLVVNAEYDVLLSEGVLLKERLEQSGVDVEYHLAEKMFHGYFGLPRPYMIFSTTLVGFDVLESFLKKHN